LYLFDRDSTSMRHRTKIAIPLAALLSGCYWEPSTSEIMVETSPPGASCVISQLGAPLSIAEPTPAIAVVDLANAEIGVTCRRPGFAEAAVTLPAPGLASTLPGYVPNRRPEIDYKTRIAITLTPALPGALQ
jgi:hypothetical protein